MAKNRLVWGGATILIYSRLLESDNDRCKPKVNVNTFMAIDLVRVTNPVGLCNLKMNCPTSLFYYYIILYLF